MTHPAYTFLMELNEHDWVITPNQRLRVFLEKEYHFIHAERGEKAWTSPRIVTFQQFLAVLFSAWKLKHHSTIQLFSAIETKRLWKDIVVESEETALLFKSNSTSDEAHAAWNLLKQWKLSIDAPPFSSATEYRTFQHWASRYQKKLNGNVDEVCALQLLCGEDLDFFFEKNAGVYAVGFLEYTPLQEELFSKIHFLSLETAQKARLLGTNGDRQDKPRSSRGGALFAPSRGTGKISPSDFKIKKHRFNTLDEELRAMANWAHECYQVNPKARIACIVPKLEPLQNEIKRIFQDVFEEPSFISEKFNISAGNVLIDHPIIEHTLLVLKQFIQPISTTEKNALARSVFFGKIISEWDQKNGQHSYRAWGQLVQTLLKELNWPGKQSLSSYEYQLVTRWIHVIDEAHVYDYKNDEINLNRFYQTLFIAASEIVFHPETPDANVHVLGTLEAIGLPFDYTWISMMTSDLFPAEIKPNSFIPKSMQKENNLPHASANRELFYNQKLLSSLFSFTQNVTVSFALHEDEEPKEESGFIRHLDTHHIDSVDFIDKEKILFDARKINTVDVEPVSLRKEEALPKGTTLFSLQAMCPFKAFNEIRLAVKPEEKETIGIPKHVQGSILHDALRVIWSTLTNQNQLKVLSADEENALLYKAIDLALSSRTHEKKLIEIERERQFSMLKEWLLVERNRDYFSVLETESEVSFACQDHLFRFRIDRIDALQDGNKIVMDYKNSDRYTLSKCFSTPLEDPQLPLYALARNDVSGIAFGIISKNKTALLYEPANAWGDQCKQWDAQVTELFIQFKTGAVRAAPIRGFETCRMCKQQALCRYFEEGNGHD